MSKIKFKVAIQWGGKRHQVGEEIEVSQSDYDAISDDDPFIEKFPRSLSVVETPSEVETSKVASNSPTLAKGGEGGFSVNESGLSEVGTTEVETPKETKKSGKNNK